MNSKYDQSSYSRHSLASEFSEYLTFGYHLGWWLSVGPTWPWRSLRAVLGSPWASAGRSCLSRCRRCLISGCWYPSLTTALRQAQHQVASAILTQMAQVSAHLVPLGSAANYCGHYYCLGRWSQHLLACPNSQSWRSNLILALVPLWTFC